MATDHTFLCYVNVIKYTYNYTVSGAIGELLNCDYPLDILMIYI